MDLEESESAHHRGVFRCLSLTSDLVYNREVKGKRKEEVSVLGRSRSVLRDAIEDRHVRVTKRRTPSRRLSEGVGTKRGREEREVEKIRTSWRSEIREDL